MIDFDYYNMLFERRHNNYSQERERERDSRDQQLCIVIFFIYSLFFLIKKLFQVVGAR